MLVNSTSKIRISDYKIHKVKAYPIGYENITKYRKLIP